MFSLPNNATVWLVPEADLSGNNISEASEVTHHPPGCPDGQLRATVVLVVIAIQNPNLTDKRTTSIE